MSPRNSFAEARRTRDRIVERSVALASLEGLEGLTIGRLAADLGISKSGLLGHFGSKEALQLAALERASAIFTASVWEPAADARPGLTRLRAVCERWITYLERERAVFPGGCLFTTVAVEFDGREGPVREAIARLFSMWRRRLVVDLRIAVRAGELPRDTDPRQLAFELIGLYMGLNQAIQLFGDRRAPARTRRALDRLLA
ncbi:TetR/AcrR family transcriptional regulator [Streptomyces sp. RPT161]|uniref:TetR/AcrR family transcriptional regulator n=1 Tax=Streptomyces sp. RPT161 TaxID=3015993 RepID=UPI0022B888C7|nr:TetR/AcrR family transcriptional regulator [Streptomyces sp. RPT161]